MSVFKRNNVQYCFLIFDWEIYGAFWLNILQSALKSYFSYNEYSDLKLINFMNTCKFL